MTPVTAMLWQQKENSIPSKVVKQFLLLLQQPELMVAAPLPSSNHVVAQAAKVLLCLI